MNERIKELAEHVGWDNHHTQFDTRIEKFAELIVGDFMNAIRQEWFNENNTVPEQDARSIAIHVGKKLGIESALHAVTKQFGVE